MLTILGKPGKERFCDGMSRRSFLTIGGLAMGGLALPQLLRAESGANGGRPSRSHKAVIMIFLPGGPPHQDMWDIKTDAPSEIRGEFAPIKTSVSGIEIGELFPNIAAKAERYVFIRSMVGCDGRHDAYQCMTGRPFGGQQPAGGWPCLGTTVSAVQGQVNDALPPALGLSPKTGHEEWGRNAIPGFLGAAYKPFTPEGEEVKADMVLDGASLDRLNDRHSLLKAFDKFRRDADTTGMMGGMDVYQQQAMGILTSSRLAEALDISKEDPKVVARYGESDNNLRADGAWKRVDQFLMARRLVEAGARVVTLAFSRWDWHGENFKRARQDMPMLDRGVSALVQDLYERGLDRDVSVIVWGEFGRTPKINGNAGRDHWPTVSCALMAGGGMRTGQVIGSTNRLGEHAQDRPVTYPEVFATLYHNLGINVETTTVRDLQGRPRYLVDNEAKPMREVV